MKRMKYIIVGYDRNRAIGAHNTLPWEGKLKTDMRRVRERTTGNAIIMGRRTFESIGRALPNRQNIVITHRPLDVEGVAVVDSLADAYRVVESGRDAYVFGGSQIYQLALESGTVDEILATEIDTVIDSGDAFFPALGNEWVETSRQHVDADDDNMYAFDFVTFKKS
jgi:dihydrofolate reductase